MYVSEQSPPTNLTSMSPPPTSFSHILEFCKTLSLVSFLWKYTLSILPTSFFYQFILLLRYYTIEDLHRLSFTKPGCHEPCETAHFLAEQSHQNDLKRHVFILTPFLIHKAWLSRALWNRPLFSGAKGCYEFVKCGRISQSAYAERP